MDKKKVEIRTKMAVLSNSPRHNMQAHEKPFSTPSLEGSLSGERNEVVCLVSEAVLGRDCGGSPLGVRLGLHKPDR